MSFSLERKVENGKYKDRRKVVKYRKYYWEIEENFGLEYSHLLCWGYWNEKFSDVIQTIYNQLRWKKQRR